MLVEENKDITDLNSQTNQINQLTNHQHRLVVYLRKNCVPNLMRDNFINIFHFNCILAFYSAIPYFTRLCKSWLTGNPSFVQNHSMEFD